MSDVVVHIDTTRNSNNIFYGDIAWRYKTDKGNVFITKKNKYSIGDTIKSIKISYDEK